MKSSQKVFTYFGAVALLLVAAHVPATQAAEEKIWHVKAVHPEGRLLDVKAIDKAGNIHSVKAIESEGKLYDVKGIKMFPDRVEAKIHGVEVLAHIKALPQAPESTR